MPALIFAIFRHLMRFFRPLNPFPWFQGWRFGKLLGLLGLGAIVAGLVGAGWLIGWKMLLVIVIGVLLTAIVSYFSMRLAVIVACLFLIGLILVFFGGDALAGVSRFFERLYLHLPDNWYQWALSFIGLALVGLGIWLLIRKFKKRAAASAPVAATVNLPWLLGIAAALAVLAASYWVFTNLLNYDPLFAAAFALGVVFVLAIVGMAGWFIAQINLNWPRVFGGLALAAVGIAAGIVFAKYGWPHMTKVHAMGLGLIALALVLFLARNIIADFFRNFATRIGRVTGWALGVAFIVLLLVGGLIGLRKLADTELLACNTTECFKREADRKELQRKAVLGELKAKAKFEKEKRELEKDLAGLNRPPKPPYDATPTDEDLKEKVPPPAKREPPTPAPTPAPAKVEVCIEIKQVDPTRRVHLSIKGESDASIYERSVVPETKPGYSWPVICFPTSALHGAQEVYLQNGIGQSRSKNAEDIAYLRKNMTFYRALCLNGADACRKK